MQVQTHTLMDRYFTLNIKKQTNKYSFLLQMNSSDRYSSDDVKGSTSKQMINTQQLQCSFFKLCVHGVLNEDISSCPEVSCGLIWRGWWLWTSRGRKDNTPRRRRRRPPLRLHKKAFHGWANLTKLGGSMAHKRLIGQHSRFGTIAGAAKQATKHIVMVINFIKPTLSHGSSTNFHLSPSTTTSYLMLTLTWRANNNLSICPATNQWLSNTS